MRPFALNYVDRPNAAIKRCYRCGGRFGLIRHRLALKQFCSQRCLSEYKAEIPGKISRSKVSTDGHPS